MIGREEQLSTLNANYSSEQNNLTILYGRPGIGKTTLVRELLHDKKNLYYEAGCGADFELLSGMGRCVGVDDASDYESIFSAKYEEGIRLFVFDEFQNIVKADAGFMPAVIDLVKNAAQKVMVICICSSVSWVENSMVRAIGSAAFYINSFMKLKEFSYVDMVNAFPSCDAKTVLSIYAVTGGVPKYVMLWDTKKTEKQNICELLLSQNGMLRREAEQYIREEFRETGVYNTILHCLASNRNKLNDIHAYTGYGRDKISVYLKNMIEREIVEKVFSYDVGGNENTKKGLYRIREGFLRFWFAYIYPYVGVLSLQNPEDFYDAYIAQEFSRCKLEAYIQVAVEFVGIMNEMGRLNGTYEYKGSWYGKRGNLHLIYVSQEGRSLIGEVYVEDTPVRAEELELVQETAELAGIKAEDIFMFSISGFDAELNAKQDAHLVLVDIQDL